MTYISDKTVIYELRIFTIIEKSTTSSLEEWKKGEKLLFKKWLSNKSIFLMRLFFEISILSVNLLKFKIRVL